MSRVVAPLILRTAISLERRRLSSRMKPIRPIRAMNRLKKTPRSSVLRIFLLPS